MKQTWEKRKKIPIFYSCVFCIMLRIHQTTELLSALLYVIYQSTTPYLHSAILLGFFWCSSIVILTYKHNKHSRSHSRTNIHMFGIESRFQAIEISIFISRYFALNALAVSRVSAMSWFFQRQQIIRTANRRTSIFLAFHSVYLSIRWYWLNYTHTYVEDCWRWT